MKRWIITVAVVVVAAAFITIGVCLDDTSIVLKKAINICTECIGIG